MCIDAHTNTYEWGRFMLRFSGSKIFVLKFLFVALIFAALISFKLSPTYICKAYEPDNNDTPDTATYLELDGAAEGRLEYDGDVDWYWIYVRECGLLTVNISNAEQSVIEQKYGKNISADDGIIISVYSRDGEEVFDRGNSGLYRLKESKPLELKFGGVPVGVYYICIESPDRYYTKTPYYVSASVTQIDEWEVERNGKLEKANVIDVNKEYNGYMFYETDRDCFTFELKEDGFIKLEMPYHEFIEDVKARLRLYSDGGLTELNRWSINAENWYEHFESPEIGLPAGQYYIMIDIEDQNLWRKKGYFRRLYRFNVHYSESGFWEKETNDLMSDADVVKADTVYYGSVRCNDDIDFYALNLGFEAETVLAFEHLVIYDTQNFWRIRVHSAKGLEKPIKEIYIRGDKYLTKVELGKLKKGKYYIEITGNDEKWGSETYNFILKTDHEHIYGNETTVKEPACNEEGKKKAVCKICGYERFSVIPALPHSFGEWTETKAPTCTEKGIQKSVCTRCGEIETKETDELGHMGGKWKTVIEPTCTEEGLEEQICERCGEVLAEEVIPIRGHRMMNQSVTLKEPTCEEEGEYCFLCKDCGEILSTHVLAKLNHDYGQWYDLIEPSCTTTGVKQKECRICGATTEVSTSKLSHSYGEPYKISGSIFEPPIVYKKFCIYCGDVVRVEVWDFKWVLPATIVAAVILLAGAGIAVAVIRIRKRRQCQ